jgi:hypothetical protein
VPPELPHILVLVSIDPSGFRIWMARDKQPANVEFVIATVVSAPTVPKKVSSAFWPGTLIVTVSGVPAVIVPICSLDRTMLTVPVTVF